MNRLRITIIISLIVAAAASRLLPHPPNFAPIAAVALFGGAYFPDKRIALLVPLAALLLTDMLIGFHSTMAFVYVGFAITVYIGSWLARQSTSGRILGATLASSILFFLLTNLGTWLMQGLYPTTMAGLMACYAAAIPFFQNSLLGDLFYVGLLFGGMALLERSYPAIRMRPVSA